MINRKTIAIILILIGLAVLFVMCQKRPAIITETVTLSDTLIVTDTVYVKVYRDKVVARIDTVMVDSHEYTVARYKETIDTSRVKVDLDIAYWEQLRRFDVRADISAETDTVYIFKTTTKTVEKPYKRIAIIGGITPLFKYGDKGVVINSLGLDTGIRFNGKYDLSLVGLMDGNFGARLGIAF